MAGTDEVEGRASHPLDALRFRADSRINGIIREVAAARKDQGVHLVDGERILAAAPETRQGLLGEELFYEHVHLNFDGNYRLARAFFDQTSALLPERIRVGPRRCRRHPRASAAPSFWP